MPQTPRPEFIETELAASLDRFQRYLTGTRYDRRRKLRPSTARSYVSRMRLFLRWAKTLDPTVEQARAYMEHLADGCRIRRTGAQPADATKRVRFYTLKAWFEFRRTPLTAEQEAEFLVPPTPHNARDAPIALETVDDLLSLIPDRRRYAIVRTLLATGIRRAELAALKVKHVDFAARQLWVPEVGEGGEAAAKGGRGGWVAISALALCAIQEHLASRLEPRGDDPEAPLFESLLTHGHLTPDGVTGLVAKLTEKVLGQRIPPHLLRHTFASHAAAGGPGRPPMPIVALSRQLRHASTATTLRYVHSVGGLNEAYERSSPF